MAPIERPDWTDGAPANAVAPVESRELSPDELLAEMQSYGPPTQTVEDNGPDPVAALTESQFEGARYAAEQILGSEPDSGFVAAFDKLPRGLQAKAFEVMASRPNLRGERLLDAIEKQLTLEEQYHAERWLKGLSPAHKVLLAGG